MGRPVFLRYYDFPETFSFSENQFSREDLFLFNSSQGRKLSIGFRLQRRYLRRRGRRRRGRCCRLCSCRRRGAGCGGLTDAECGCGGCGGGGGGAATGPEDSAWTNQIRITFWPFWERYNYLKHV